MKIKRLKLKNFIGIYHGLGEKEIEINFSNSKHKITMIRGQNGSGKSVIMSSLQPLKDSFDDRKNLIIPGEIGEKEIDIEYNGNLYEIKHIYSSSAQSFIKKNGIELNENGGVRTAEEIIKNELGMTKEYTKIGKIGSNTKNFVDFPTAERKNYIGNFLNIEDILEKYKIVKNKFSILKKEIQTIKNDINNYEKPEVIEEKISNETKKLEVIEKELSDNFILKGSLENSIKSINEKIIDFNIDENELYLDSLQKSFLNHKNIENTFKIKYPDETEPKKTFDDLERIYNELDKKLSIEQTKMEGILNRIIEIKESIEKNNIELKSLGNPEDLEKMKSELASKKAKSEELKINIQSNKFAKLVNSIKKNNKNPEILIEKFKNFTDVMEEYFSKLQEKSFNKIDSNISLFLNDDFLEKIAIKQAEIKTSIKGKDELINSQEKEIAKNESFIGQLENLKMRPSECHIDYCPFIKTALDHKNVLSEIETQKLELETSKKAKESLMVQLENSQELERIYKVFKSAYESVSPRENLIFTNFTTEKSLEKWVNGQLSEFSLFRQELIKGSLEANEEIIAYIDLTKSISILEKSIKALEDSDSSVREHYQKIIKDLNENLIKTEKEKDEFSPKFNQLNQELSTTKQTKDDYNDYIEAVSLIDSESEKIEKLTKEIENYNKSIKELNELKEKLNNTNFNITSKTQEKTETQKIISNLNSSYSQIGSLKKKLEKIDSKFIPTEAVMNSLSPTLGIPLILIQLYLDKTEQISNELLELAFNGDFKIHFDAGEKDFFIKVKAKNNEKEDIKLASQGEIAITTLSINLALIEQSLNQYNILCLDEIDGPLDFSNRSNFISILEKQIDKLGLEQVFVISHNDAFDICAMDLILLKGSRISDEDEEFLKNKNILFKIKE